MADAAGNAMQTTGEESLRALLHEHDLLGYAEKMIDYGTDSAKRLLKIGRADFDAMVDSASMKPGHMTDMLSVIRTKRPAGCDPIDAGPPLNTPTASQSRAKRPKTNSCSCSSASFLEGTRVCCVPFILKLQWLTAR